MEYVRGSFGPITAYVGASSARDRSQIEPRHEESLRIFYFYFFSFPRFFNMFFAQYLLMLVDVCWTLGASNVRQTLQCLKHPFNLRIQSDLQIIPCHPGHGHVQHPLYITLKHHQTSTWSLSLAMARCFEVPQSWRIFLHARWNWNWSPKHPRPVGSCSHLWRVWKRWRLGIWPWPLARTLAGGFRRIGHGLGLGGVAATKRS
jgi:hypothetical protein